MLGTAGKLPLGEAWEDTAIALPPGALALANVLSGGRLEATQGSIPLAKVCARLPLAALLVT
jgi:maltooligosyltrehalose synthase